MREAVPPSAARATMVLRSLPPVALILLAGMIVLPAITWAERVTFRLGPIDMNVRVAVYFTLGALATAAAVPIAIRMANRPRWFLLMGVMLGWLLLTSLIARQGPVEWVPTVVRFALYFSTALIFYSYFRSLADPARTAAVAWLLPLAVLAMAIIPAISGLAELVRGDAPFLNGAPRVSGSMIRHPVAFSLVLAVSVLATVAPAIIRGTARGAVARWCVIGGLIIVIFLTYTRLTVVLLVIAAMVIAALLPAPRRRRAARAGAMLLAGIAVVVLAQPVFEARFIYAAPIGHVIEQPDITPVPGTPSAAPPSPSASGSGGVVVDASVGYRIKLTQRGIAYIAESPIVGHGPGSFDRLNEGDTGIAGVAAHNDFLTYAVETGLPGMVIYLVLLLSLAGALWPRASTGHQEVDALVVSALVILGAVNVAGAIHNPTYFVEIQLPIWMLVGAGLGVQARAAAARLQPS